jgi:hypothetical protein
MDSDKRKAEVSDSDDDFAPSADASPVAKAKPTKKKAKSAKSTDDADGAKDPKEKKEKVKELDYGVDLTLADQSPELTAKYDAMSVTELGQWLKSNRMNQGAAKKDKVARCVDGELFGALPSCPRCLVGNLKVAYESVDAHGGQGKWTCGGYFDSDIKMRSKCHFSALPGEVTRLPWRDLHDPAPEPAKPGAGGTPKEIVLPTGFESLPPKDAAAALKEIATTLGYQLPMENANAEIGSTLMMTKSEFGWDGLAALNALREIYPPLTSEEAAGGPPCLMPENDGLCACLDKLVRLETQGNGDAFKIRAYKTAAMEIRALDRVVTSGKACAKADTKKSQTKVKGVGKGLGEKIDEFLQTGTMARITELEERSGAGA